MTRPKPFCPLHFTGQIDFTRMSLDLSAWIA